MPTARSSVQSKSETLSGELHYHTANVDDLHCTNCNNYAHMHYMTWIMYRYIHTHTHTYRILPKISPSPLWPPSACTGIFISPRHYVAKIAMSAKINTRRLTRSPLFIVWTVCFLYLSALSTKYNGKNMEISSKCSLDGGHGLAISVCLVLRSWPHDGSASSYKLVHCWRLKTRVGFVDG